MWELLLGHSLWAFRSGEIAFARGWPLWVLFVLAALGLAAIAWTLLRGRALGLGRLAVLGLLQLAFLALLLILLWRPVLNVERIRDRENVVAVLVDDSGSMNTRPAAGAPSLREQAVRALQAGVTDELAASSELRLFSFSNRAASVESLAELKGGAAATRIGEALESITQMAASVPLAGIVVVTDGAETGGTLDEAALARLAATGIPVHTVGVGPETPSNDLELEQLQVPGTGVAGETLRATVSIRHQDQRSTRVRIYDGGELIAAQEVALGGSGLTTATVDFPAGKAGLRDLRAVLDTARDESNIANNARRALVEVSDRRRSILYVEGEPRWEYKFIRRAIEADRSLRLVSAVRATPNRYYRQGVSSGTELEDGFPRTAAELNGYDAVIIGSLEAAALSTEQHEWLRDFVDRRGGSLLMLAGRDGMGDGGWGRVPVGPLLPAVLPKGATAGYGARASQVRLTTYGASSAIGQLDADPAKNGKQWSTLPPLADYQTVGRLRPGAIVLLEAVAGERGEPLLVTQRYGRGATWLLATATTWRWQMRLPLPDQRHELFWRQLLHALTTPSPAQVSLRADRSVTEDAAALTLEAEVLDETFRATPRVQVEVTATADSGESVPVRVEPSGRDDGRYTVNVQSATPGLYRIELQARAGDRALPSAIAHLRREDGVLEQFSAYQHRPMLERIARETGGRYWRLDQIGELPEAMRYSRAGMVERQTLDLWNMPLAFLLLGLLKLAEWLLRRRWRRL